VVFARLGEKAPATNEWMTEVALFLFCCSLLLAGLSWYAVG